jgi:hypothetical protein
MPKEKRDAPIQVQLTASEKRQVIAAADARGITASTLLRNVTLAWLQEHPSNERTPV